MTEEDVNMAVAWTVEQIQAPLDPDCWKLQKLRSQTVKVWLQKYKQNLIESSHTFRGILQVKVILLKNLQKLFIWTFFAIKSQGLEIQRTGSSIQRSTPFFCFISFLWTSFLRTPGPIIFNPLLPHLSSNWHLRILPTVSPAIPLIIRIIHPVIHTHTDLKTELIQAKSYIDSRFKY